ncbi:MAG: hypothetical protein L3K13_06285, partial [Thermoplasmata archaeon]|nr:hypothetical protein [Thermoplasmata archaeon]
ALIIAGIPAYLGPRLTRIGLLQRRELLESLARLNPSLASFRASLAPVSNRARGLFLTGMLAAAFGPALLMSVGPVSFHGVRLDPSGLFVSPVGTYLLVFSILSRTLGARAAKRQAPPAPNASPESPATELPKQAPALYLRVFALQLAALGGVGFAAAIHPAGLLTAGNWTVLGESVAFCVFYAFQDLDRMIQSEDALFQEYRARTKAAIPVLIYVGEVGEPSGEALPGNLAGIGSKLRIVRDDGFAEEISWASVGRAATMP